MTLAPPPGRALDQPAGRRLLRGARARLHAQLGAGHAVSSDLGISGRRAGLSSGRDRAADALGRPGQPAALGVPPRDQRVRRPDLGELAERGHRVLIAAPSDSRTAIRESRRAISAANDDPDSLLAGENRGCWRSGSSIPLPSGPRRRPPPIPVDVSRTLEQLLERVAFDIVHVHEPFAPSPGRRRCATRSPSTSRPSTSRPRGSSRPRSRGCWSRCSSGGSMPGPRAARRPASCSSASSRGRTS